MSSKPSIAFISLNNPMNRNTWSGTPFYMIKAIQRNWGNVEVYYWKRSRLQKLIIKMTTMISRYFFKKDYDYIKSIHYSKVVGKHLSSSLLRKNHDIIICNCSFPIAYLETDTPIIIYTDSAFGLLLDYYSNTNYFNKFLQSGRIIEQRGYDKASIIVFSSSWAADFARKNYSCRNKITVIPFGANIESTPNISIMDYRIQNRDTCNLLFLGVDWKRKGGDIVIETLDILKERGI